MRKATVQYFCDFCGRENIESQFTKVEIRGHIDGPEIACPNCLNEILKLLESLRKAARP